MKPYCRLSDAELVLWYNNFRDNALAYASTLGLSASELTAITNAASDYASIMGVYEQARVNAKAATTDKNATREAVQSLAGEFANRFKANTSISDSILESLGLPPREGTPSGPVQTPTSLAVSGDATGVNTLKWKRNGNPSGTLYTVERRYGVTGGWERLLTTKLVRFKDQGQPVGELTFYRVFATYGGESSTYSNEASIYGQEGGGSTTLEFAA